MDDRLTFGVLGPVELRVNSQPVAIGPAMQRAVLTVLLLRANRTVSADEIADLLWTDEPPRTARKNIQLYVWRLRQLVGLRLESTAAGYRLIADSAELDLGRFEALLESARAAARAGLPDQAVTDYRAALDLWRGTALADLAGIGRLNATAVRLDRQRLLAYEERIDVELELDRHAEVVPLLDELAATHPLHERFVEQQVLALYRANRRADAADAYQRCRKILDSELGVEPGPVLQRLMDMVREPSGDRSSSTAGWVPDPALRQLPHTINTFVGRDTELTLLSGTLTMGHGTAIPVCVVTGRAGVGKSALAIHTAHQLTAAFPDGQLYVDLHGATAGLRPVSPLDVLGRFLRVLGVTNRAIPTQLEEASAHFRSLLANRRMLLVLDNALDASQVRPLIPAGTQCAVIVTSRRGLGDIDGADQIELDALPDAEALTLLARLAGGARVAAEQGAAAELVRWSGGLPLAIRIAGARLAARSSWSIATLASRLRDERNRLRELRLGDIAVRTSFLVSYQHLQSPLAQRLFRLLSAVELRQVTIPVAAALLGVSRSPAQDAVEELVDARLLDEASPDRYKIHDLIRLFAQERADAEEAADLRGAATDRVLRHYLNLTRHALNLLYPGSRVVIATGPPRFTDRGGALAWLEAERTNLVSATIQATGSTDHRTARLGVELADTMYLFFETRGHVEDWIAVDQAAIDAARRLTDQVAEARLLHDLAVAHYYLHRIDEAADCLRESLRLSRQVGDEDGEARALNQFGILHGELGEYDRAAEYLTASLRLRERLGDLRACAATQGNIGMAYRLAGRYEESIRFCRSSARLARRGGAAEIEANALGVLGEVHCLMGRYESALRCLRRSLAVRGLAMNERNRGSTMGTLAEAYLGAGRIKPAIRHATLAVEAFRRADFRHGEAVALRRLGRMLCEHDDAVQGVNQLRLALTIFAALGSPEAVDVRAELHRAQANRATER